MTEYLKQVIEEQELNPENQAHCDYIKNLCDNFEAFYNELEKEQQQ